MEKFWHRRESRAPKNPRNRGQSQQWPSPPGLPAHHQPVGLIPPRQHPSTEATTYPSLEKAKAPPDLLTEGPISSRLEDVAGSTEALYESGDTLAAASPSPQGA